MTERLQNAIEVGQQQEKGVARSQVRDAENEGKENKDGRLDDAGRRNDDDDESSV